MHATSDNGGRATTNRLYYGDNLDVLRESIAYGVLCPENYLPPPKPDAT